MMNAITPLTEAPAVEIRVRGRVQGVGFRPTVWRIARELGLAGEVLNDGHGVLVRARGDRRDLAALIERMTSEAPPLARIDAIEPRDYPGPVPAGFRIAESASGGTHTEIAPDAAICADCRAELHAPSDRHHRYAFTSCTHCGPRLSIVTAIPYDRAATTMADFPLCAACRGEYKDPADRRFHAEAVACATCGPRLSLVTLAGGADSGDDEPIEGAVGLLRQGAIIAVKGIGGYHLACDATNPKAVDGLRRAKHRDRKPFALMARDVDVVGRYASIDQKSAEALSAPAGPIVLLDAAGTPLPDAIAPGLATLGFMLPTTPLHYLLIQSFESPLVMTSGNLSGAPTITDDAEARRALISIASHALVHDRRIANRLDDSVLRVVAGRPRLLRRARGYAPAPIALPPGFERSPDLLALGGELKSTICLVQDGRAILSQHLGDLEEASTFADFRRNLKLYSDLFDHAPTAVVIDQHPEYLSAKFGRTEAARRGLPLMAVQHHHAHIAACLAENGRQLDASPVLGIVLDGIGYGEDGTLWGGELLFVDYRICKRLGRLKPVAMPGGTQAIREPWRNLYAQLAALGTSGLATDPLFAGKPAATIDAMIAKGVNAPLSSSCGRLFDAVAAALGLCFDRQAYEGEAAMRLEALAAECPGTDRGAYPFAVGLTAGLAEIDPAPLWRHLRTDQAASVPVAIVATRFHRGLAQALVECAMQLHKQGRRFDTVALSGGCFQNRLLLEATIAGFHASGFTTLTHSDVPTNDGGLALGQAAIGAASALEQGIRACA
jgi:hydrogenase maturation protein HypF